MRVFNLQFKVILFLISTIYNTSIIGQTANSTELPIDGYWIEYINVFGTEIKNGNRYSIRNGKLIFEEGNIFTSLLLREGDAIGRNIKMVSKYNYICESISVKGLEIELNLRDGDLYLIIDKNKKFGNSYYTSSRLVNKSLNNINLYNYYYNPSFSQAEVEYIDEIIVNTDMTTQRISAGVKMEIEKTHVLKKEASYSSTSADLQKSTSVHNLNAFGLGVEIENLIENKIENTSTSNIKNDETFKAKIILDGDKATTWKIIWKDRYKRGKIDFTDSAGLKKILYFRIPLSSEIEVVPLN